MLVASIYVVPLGLLTPPILAQFVPSKPSNCRVSVLNLISPYKPLGRALVLPVGTRKPGLLICSKSLVQVPASKLVPPAFSA